MGCREMRILHLALILMCFSADASFKDWFGEKVDAIKETDAWQKISNAASKAEHFAKNNERGTISPEVLKAHKNFLDLTIEFEEGIKTGIETFKALKSEKYEDQIELYEKVQSELKTLKNHLSKKLGSIVNCKVMIRFSRKNVENIVDILKEDQGMLSLSTEFHNSFKEFEKSLEKLEKDLNTTK